MSDDPFAIAAMHVAEHLPRFEHSDEAFGQALDQLGALRDFERDLCKAGIHRDSCLHPHDCPERAA